MNVMVIVAAVYTIGVELVIPVFLSVPGAYVATIPLSAVLTVVPCFTLI